MADSCLTKSGQDCYNAPVVQGRIYGRLEAFLRGYRPIPVASPSPTKGEGAGSGYSLAHPGQRAVVGIATGGEERGLAPIGANATMGALRSGLAIGEVQARLNPHVGSGERGVSPLSPGQWTVMAIALGWGQGRGT